MPKRGYGKHVRALRRGRNLTQEQLSERSGLSADTIRRLEHESFSPSLDTLKKLCHGLDLRLSTFFHTLELGAAAQHAQELRDLFAAQPAELQALGLSVLRELFALLDRQRQ